MKDERSDHLGKFVSNVQRAPLRTIDCSEWQAVDFDQNWTTGHVQKNFVIHPPTTVDCTTWKFAAEFWLQSAVSPFKVIAATVMQPDRKADEFCNVLRWSLEIFRSELLLLDLALGSGGSSPEHGNGRQFKYIEVEDFLDGCRPEIRSLVETERDAKRLARKLVIYAQQSASKLRSAMLVQRSVGNGDCDSAKSNDS